MTRKGLVAATVGAFALAVPSSFADQGGVPHEGSNGQGRPADQQQTAPEQAAADTAPQGEANGQAKAHGKAAAPGQTKAKPKAKPQAKAPKAAKPATPNGPPATNTHAKAGKTTLCHATGSATNPYVTITISNNAIPAHARHQDGRDIIPAPAEGCPTGESSTPEQPVTPGGDEQAPAATTEGASTPTEQPGQVMVLGEHVADAPGSPAEGEVLGTEVASGPAPSASASPEALATRAADAGSLPFTGRDALIVALLGIGLLGAGLAGRRLAADS